MLMAVTPFAPKRPDNVTELFTNIAMVKVSLVVLTFGLLGLKMLSVVRRWLYQVQKLSTLPQYFLLSLCCLN